MFTHVRTAAVDALTAFSVVVEVHTQKGQAVFFMVGLPTNAVRESRNRVEAALQNSGFRLMMQNTTVNFAPADVRKEGSGYDLPLAIGLLGASKLVETAMLERFLLVGELGLDGSVRPIKGALPIAIMARKKGFEGLILPADNAEEAAVVNDLKVYGARHLSDVADFLNGRDTLRPTEVDTRAEFAAAQKIFDLDLHDVKGQMLAKRAFEVAAAGGHNLLLIGPPGCGKSMMAKRIPTILPRLTLAESLETTQIHSVAGKLGNVRGLIAQRPFRSPHHTISDVALIGGGVSFQPGEISLAHNGVLFLDELPEFSRHVLETLRGPLEDRHITVSRAKYTATLPCSFMLVASMNPCPCGYYGHPTHPCSCTPGQIANYRQKISGPLLDRIDLQVAVQPVGIDELTTLPCGETSEVVRQRVEQARAIQHARFQGENGTHCNAQMTATQLERYAQLDETGKALLMRMMQRLHLSARSYERLRKVARTIADLDNSVHISAQHLSEAIAYRNLDAETPLSTSR